MAQGGSAPCLRADDRSNHMNYAHQPQFEQTTNSCNFERGIRRQRQGYYLEFLALRATHSRRPRSLRRTTCYLLPTLALLDDRLSCATIAQSLPRSLLFGSLESLTYLRGDGMNRRSGCRDLPDITAKTVFNSPVDGIQIYISSVLFFPVLSVTASP
jgi:hypothetical protein